MSLEDRVKKEGKGEMERIDPQEKGGGRMGEGSSPYNSSALPTHSLTHLLAFPSPSWHHLTAIHPSHPRPAARLRTLHLDFQLGM